jgi:hypothetical protein
MADLEAKVMTLPENQKEKILSELERERTKEIAAALFDDALCAPRADVAEKVANSLHWFVLMDPHRSLGVIERHLNQNASRRNERVIKDIPHLVGYALSSPAYYLMLKKLGGGEGKSSDYCIAVGDVLPAFEESSRLVQEFYDRIFLPEGTSFAAAITADKLPDIGNEIIEAVRKVYTSMIESEGPESQKRTEEDFPNVVGAAKRTFFKICSNCLTSSEPFIVLRAAETLERTRGLLDKRSLMELYQLAARHSFLTTQGRVKMHFERAHGFFERTCPTDITTQPAHFNVAPYVNTVSLLRRFMQYSGKIDAAKLSREIHSKYLSGTSEEKGLDKILLEDLFLLASYCPEDYSTFFKEGIQHSQEVVRLTVATSLRFFLTSINHGERRNSQDEDRQILEAYLESKYSHVNENPAAPPKDKNKLFAEVKTLLESGASTSKVVRTVSSAKAKNLEDIIDCLRINIPGHTLLARIDRGTYKTAYLCVNDRLPDNLRVALIAPLSDPGQKPKEDLDGMDRDAVENCDVEARKLDEFLAMRDPHLPIKYHGPDIITIQGRQFYYWVEELVPVKLLDIIKEGEQVERCRALDWSRQIALALAVAKRVGYIHGDLKFDNIGLSGDVIKVLDWGMFSTLYSDVYNFEGKDFRVYRLARPPEVYERKSASSQSDVWAVGVLLYRMLTGEYPFMWDDQITQKEIHGASSIHKARCENQIYDRILEYRENPSLLPSLLSSKGIQESSDVYKILLDCLSYEPNERPTVEKLATRLAEAISKEKRQ